MQQQVPDRMTLPLLKSRQKYLIFVFVLYFRTHPFRRGPASRKYLSDPDVSPLNIDPHFSLL